MTAIAASVIPVGAFCFLTYTANMAPIGAFDPIGGIHHGRSQLRRPRTFSVFPLAHHTDPP